jgi:PAS domain S-box-containing protein
LASIVQTSEDAIVGYSLEGRIESWNRGAQLLFGYQATEVLGKPLAMLVPPERAGIFRTRVLGRLQRGEQVPQYEGVGWRKDGTRVEVSVSSCTIKNTTGLSKCGAAIIRDISLRRNAEETRGLLASIVESSHDAIFTSTLDGTIITWNHGAEVMFGYREPEIRGKSVSVLAPAERLAEQAEVLAKLRNGERIAQLETTTLRTGGALIDVSLTVSPIRNAAGDIIGTSTIAHDISGRKRTETAIAESEHKYRSLVANIPDLVWTADAVGRTVFVSRNCERTYGYTPEEVCQPDWWYSRIHPDDAQRVHEAYEALFERHQPYDVECRFQKKNGEWIWIHDRATHSYERGGHRFTDGILSDFAFMRESATLSRNEPIL